MKKIHIFLALVGLGLIIGAASAQTNPQTQITWPRVTGSGAPTSTCPSTTNTTTTATIGTPYTDLTNSNQYTCMSAGWVKINGGGSGSGPNNFPGTAHQFVTSYNSGTLNFASAQPVIADVSGLSAALALLAPIANPAFTGVAAAPVFNATTGFQIGGTAPSGHFLLGNGTDYVDSTAFPACATCVVEATGVTTGIVPIWQNYGGNNNQGASNFIFQVDANTDSIYTTDGRDVLIPPCIYMGAYTIDCGGGTDLQMTSNVANGGAAVIVRDAFAESHMSVDFSAFGAANDVSNEHSVWMGVNASTIGSGTGYNEPDSAYILTEFDNLDLNISGKSVNFRGNSGTSALSAMKIGSSNTVLLPTLGAATSGLIKSAPTTGLVSNAVAGTDYQIPITLTTTGTTGAATFSGGTLNIPNYASGSGSGTVTHTVGALTALDCVIGNGAADIKVDPNCSTDGAGNMTAVSYTASGATPGAVSVVAGTGSIPALPANSAGLGAPPSGGTSYLLEMPSTITVGILHASSPGTVSGVNQSLLTSSAVNLASTDVTGLLPHANIAATAVTPGSYTSANITVAADGSITAATNGSGGVSSVSNSDGTLTISPTTGPVVASLNLGHANSWTAVQTLLNPIISGGAINNATIGLTTAVAGTFTTSTATTYKTTSVNSGTVATVASASTIAPTTPIILLTGSTVVHTITPPTGCTTSGTDCVLEIITDASGPPQFANDANIIAGYTLSIDAAITIVYDPATSKWYPAPAPGGGSTLTPSDGPLIVNASGAIATPLPFARMYSFGTSYESGAGVVDFNQAFVSLLHKDVAAPLFPHGASGTKTEAISANALDNYFPDATLPNLVIMGGSENDSGQTCSLTTPCETQYGNTTMATMAWLANPYEYRLMASKATATGTWTADTNLGTVACSATTNCPYTPIGTPMKSSASGSTLTFNLTTTTAQTHIRVTSNVQTAQTGTYTVTIDGSLVTDNCSVTTTFTAVPCGGSWASGSTAFGMSAQQYTVTGATTHTVLVTTTNSGVTGIVSVDVDPLTSATNLNTVMFQGQNQFFTNFATYNTLSTAVVAMLKAANLNTYFVSPVTGTPGFNQASDVSTTASATCAASIAASHLNYCGNVNATQTFENTAKADGIQFTCYNCGGNVVNQGDFDGRVSIHTVANGTSPTTYDSAVGIASNAETQLGSYIELLKLSNTARYGVGNFTDSSSGFFWSGSFPIGSYGTNQDWCDYLWTPVLVNGTPRWTQADFKAVHCTQFSTGETGQLGGMTAPWIGGTVGGTLPTIAVGTGAGSATGGTVALSRASNISGIITVVTGTVPIASSTVGTVTFGATNTQAYQTSPKCNAWPANAIAQTLVGVAQAFVIDATTTTASFTFTSGSTALPASSTLIYSYLCTQ